MGGLSEQAVSSSIVGRSIHMIAERERVDQHVLERWQAITSAPMNAAASNDVSTIIRASFRSLKTFGQGFNSAGIAFGSAFYRYRN